MRLERTRSESVVKALQQERAELEAQLAVAREQQEVQRRARESEWEEMREEVRKAREKASARGEKEREERE